jgi:hypothetical protein
MTMIANLRLMTTLALCSFSAIAHAKVSLTHTPCEAEKNLKDRIAQIQHLIAEEKLVTPKEKDLALA